jgi:2-polyprenyl-6-methoxyphenol hydroxylase-like FAD-dependent oxidoreductase
MSRVLISGASIAGPTLAYWLSKAGFDVTVIERAKAPRQGGQAIDIRGPALKIVRAMGLLDRVASMRTRLKGMSTVDIDGREVSRTEERTISGGRFNSGDIEILRDDLAVLLLNAGHAAASYRYGDTITGLEQDDTGVSVSFETAAPQRFDLVIGADGVYSNTRHIVFGNDPAFIRPLGVVLAIFTAPNMSNLQDLQIAYRDDTSGYVVYPDRDNKELRVNLGFGLLPEDDARGSPAAQKALVAKRCGHLGGDIPRLIETMFATDDFYIGALAQVRMESWSKGRVTLVGDAAYCPSPFTGQGTGLALIGAFVLARELARSPKDFAAGFERCERRMLPFVRKNQDMLDLSRREPVPDDIFDAAKNAIDIDDLLETNNRIGSSHSARPTSIIKLGSLQPSVFEGTGSDPGPTEGRSC